MFIDLFPGWTIVEIIRINELAFMAMLILASCFMIGMEPAPVRVARKTSVV